MNRNDLAAQLLVALARRLGHPAGLAPHAVRMADELQEALATIPPWQPPPGSRPEPLPPMLGISPAYLVGERPRPAPTSVPGGPDLTRGKKKPWWK